MEAIAESVRSADRRRYTSVLYAPKEKREALFVLYDFNLEIARIRDAVKEPLAGEMRLQWWHDAISGGATTETAGHPVADALIRIVAEFELPVSAFVNMIEARRFDIYNDPMPSRNDLEGYCGETAGALIQLASMVLDRAGASHHGEAAGHAGCALAIAGLLSLLPVHRRRGQCYLPADLLASVGASPDELADSVPGPGGLRAVKAMIALGREHASAFELAASEIPTAMRAAYLPLAAVDRWFDALDKVGEGVFEVSITPSPLIFSISAFRRAMFGWR